MLVALYAFRLQIVHSSSAIFNQRKKKRITNANENNTNNKITLVNSSRETRTQSLLNRLSATRCTWIQCTCTELILTIYWKSIGFELQIKRSNKYSIYDDIRTSSHKLSIPLHIFFFYFLFFISILQFTMTKNIA